MEEKFKDLIYKKCSNAMADSTLAMLAIIALGAFNFYGGLTTGIKAFYLLAIGITVAAAYFLKTTTGEFKGGAFWVDLIMKDSEKVVWIKPIITTHTIGIVIPLYKERKFQLLTTDGLKVTIRCDTEDEQQIFLGGVSQYLSHAHLGYSIQISELYNLNSNKFIQHLKTKDLYTPAGESISL